MCHGFPHCLLYICQQHLHTYSHQHPLHQFCLIFCLFLFVGYSSISSISFIYQETLMSRNRECKHVFSFSLPTVCVCVCVCVCVTYTYKTKRLLHNNPTMLTFTLRVYWWTLSDLNPHALHGGPLEWVHYPQQMCSIWQLNFRAFLFLITPFFHINGRLWSRKLYVWFLSI